MQNLIILNVQVGMALLTFFLLFRTYFQDWLKRQPFLAAVQPLLFFHVFRFLGLNVLVTGQVDPELPLNALKTIAFGDFASAVCALMALLAISTKSRIATPLLVLFSFVGIGDLILVGPTAINGGIFYGDIGTIWWLTATLAPILVLSHGYIAFRLVKHLREPLGAA